jgi:polysaccharide export outer membrane protein
MRVRPGLMGRFMLVLLLAVAACAPGTSLPPLPDGEREPYRLATGDNLRINVFDDSRLTGEFRVNDSGNVALPLVGSVRAAGLTSAELEAAIVGALRRSGLFQRPTVAVEVAEYRPVYLLGEVSRPGPVEFRPGMTMLTAITVGGGFTYRAYQEHFSVLRQDGSEPPIERRASRQAFVRPGDVITVLERRF